ncbi:MAG: alpha-isopropylmalate synthase regulatory domain-containing protein, partial [Planctomycetota bacterium]|nr:alpha-isopropylmalate synthase regulatory domain-containing protein [Planctomycetota bacterium]
TYNVDVESSEPEDGNVRTEATVKLSVGNNVRHEVAEGDGPVNALDAALRKALGSIFPHLNRMHLLDYKVRVINAQEGTAARVRVSIESTDGERVWGTVGVSENVIEASWLALADSFHFYLAAGEGNPKAPL